MLTMGWYYADPRISAGLGLFILPRTWALLKDAVGVLLEGTPADVNVAAVRAGREQISGLAGLHDSHVWSLTSGVKALSVHVVRDANTTHDEVLARVRQQAAYDFKIAPPTVPVETAGGAAHATHC